MLENVESVVSTVSFWLILVVTAVPLVAQQTTDGQTDEGSSTPLETLTIQLNNGTADTEGTGEITGVVFDIDKYRSSSSAGEQSSLIEGLKKHGTRFQTGKPTTTVTLDQPVANPMLVVVYKGGIYQKKLDTGKAEQQVSLTVYEPTRNPDTIRIQRHHMPLQRSGDRLRVSEIIRFQNTGDRTYIGPEGFNKSIPITLPENVHQVQGARQGSDSEASGDGNTYWLSKTVSPGGMVTARVSYHLPLDGSLTLERQVDYPTSSFFFVARKQGLQITSTSSNLQKRSRSAPSGKGDVVQITGNSLSKGDTVSVTLKPAGTSASGNMSSGATGEGAGGMTQTETSETDSSEKGMTYLMIIIGVVAGLSLIVSFSAIVLMYRSGSSQGLESSEDDLSREMLVEEIAQLDQDLEDGKINEEYHEERRARLKSRLMSLEADEGSDAPTS